MKKFLIPAVCILLCIALGGAWLVHRATSEKSEASRTTDSKTATTEKQPSVMTPNFDKQQHSLTDPTSLWVIVNKQHPLDPLNYAPADLVAVGNGQYLR